MARTYYSHDENLYNAEDHSSIHSRPSDISREGDKLSLPIYPHSRNVYIGRKGSPMLPTDCEDDELRARCCDISNEFLIMLVLFDEIMEVLEDASKTDLKAKYVLKDYKDRLLKEEEANP
tara:strand:+ start:313 stop:672 length:360 start_codon:yes stop_codon:yes gene_type:complete